MELRIEVAFRYPYLIRVFGLVSLQRACVHSKAELDFLESVLELIDKSIRECHTTLKVSELFDLPEDNQDSDLPF